MTDRELDALLDNLNTLGEDTPPMPEDLHQQWMRLVEEDTMKNEFEPKESKKRGLSRGWKRALAVAAAAVFVVGGTLLTRDDLPSRFSAAPESGKAVIPQEAVYTSEEAAYGAYADYDTGYVANSSAKYAAPAAAMYEDDLVEMEETAMGGERYTANSPEAPARPQKLIRNASLTIVTQDFDASYAQLNSLCEAAGGWVSSSSVSTGSKGLKTASITLRIPAGQLDSFLAGSGEAGRVTSQSLNTNDVTDSYYDTLTRLETQKELMARLRALVTEAADLSDLLELENEIASTQYMIDSLTASLQSTDQKVSYSTVSISLKEERPQETAQAVELSLGERLSGALQLGWERFTDFVADCAVFLVAALPFLAIVAVVVTVVLIVSKKRRKN